MMLCICVGAMLTGKLHELLCMRADPSEIQDLGLKVMSHSDRKSIEIWIIWESTA